MIRYVYIIATILILSVPNMGPAWANDLPTLEALIKLHKNLKRDEEEAKKNVAASYGEQTVITRMSEKYNNVRTTLDTKVNDVHQLIVLGSAISTTAKSLYDLTKEYWNFSNVTYRHVKDKPFLLYYYADATIQIEKEIAHCTKLYKGSAVANNFIRSTAQEKLKLIFTLKSYIESCRGHIWRANLYCRCMIDGDYKPDYIWEILGSDMTRDIAKKVAEAWVDRH